MIVTVPNPVSDGVGYDPTSPVIVVVPVLVMPEYARTAKGEAVPKFTEVDALEGPAENRKLNTGKNNIIVTASTENMTILLGTIDHG